jgi:hypothetical protein
MTIQATIWAIALRDFSPVAKLAAIYISDNFDETTGRASRWQPPRAWRAKHGRVADYPPPGERLATHASKAATRLSIGSPSTTRPASWSRAACIIAK